jgi:ankyrin repeat protein
MSCSIFSSGSVSADDDQLLLDSSSATNTADSHFQLPIRRHLSTRNDNGGDTVARPHNVPKATDDDAADDSDSDSTNVIFTPASGMSEDEDQGSICTERKAIQSCRTNTSTHLDGFYEAISRGDITTVKEHLAANISPCCKNNSGFTPLIVALQQSQLEMAKFLLENGASVHQRANNIPPIIWAIMKPHLRARFVRLFLSHGALLSTTSGANSYNALHWAARDGIVEGIQLLLDEGMNIEVADSQGRTALFLAAEFGHIEVLKILIVKGARLDHRGRCSETVLAWAACHDQADAVKCLYEAGVRVNDRDDLGIGK